ncbi:Remorin_C domain-containing protein, partial [Psidium guajava]
TSRSGGGEDELAAAVAAAAIAVTRLDEDSVTPDRSPTGAGPESTLTKAKSKRQKGSTQLGTGEESLERPDIKIPITGPARTVRKRSTFAEKLLESSEDAKEGAPTPPKPSPSIKKASSSADKRSKKAASMKPEISSPPMPEPLPTITPVAPPPPPPELETRQSPAIPGGESKADAWIRQELSRIKERYDNLNATIVSWEIKKKKKARRKLDVTEGELERKRSKALQTFRAEMERIGQIAASAREQAEERQRKEEWKARDKANKIRTTGKPPPTCFCF